MTSSEASGAPAVGDAAPGFDLPDTNGEQHRLDHGAPAVIVFTCNHCPYALAWHDRIAASARDYGGVRFYAINSNDSERYPRDSYQAMQRRVAEEDWPLPYLHDASQDVARAYGARTTPDVFILDGEGIIRYRGAPDADYSDEAENASWLRDALDAVLEGRTPERQETEPVGCGIKWKG